MMRSDEKVRQERRETDEALDLGGMMRCPGVHRRDLPQGVSLIGRTNAGYRYTCPDKYGCGLTFTVGKMDAHRQLQVLSDRGER